MSGYYNWILVNFILNITKRPDFNVTSGKPRENHMTTAPFANLVEWKIWKRRTLIMLELFSKSTVFAFRPCDCGIWRWIGWPDCSSISFSSSTESELHKDPALSINLLLLLLLFNGKPLVVRIHLRPVMVRYGLAKVWRGVKAPQTRKKSGNGFRNLFLQGLVSHSENI